MKQLAAGLPAPVREALPELWGARRVLAVVAHPDDESFGLGGLLASLAAGGLAVDLLCLSHGETSTLGASPGLGAVRDRELHEAARLLGLREAWLEDLPDGHLSEYHDRIAELVETRLGDADALVVLEPSGVTGHPDHRAATAVAQQVADRHGLVTLQWGVSPAVAAALADELGARLVGLDGPDIRLVHVDRATQAAAVARHRSQHPDNPLLARRLALQGDSERIRVVSAPFAARLERFVAATGPLVRPEAGPEDRETVLDRLVAFAAGDTWPDGALAPGDPYGVHCLHDDPAGWSLATVVLDGGATPVHDHESWGAAATAQGIERNRRFAGRCPDALRQLDTQLAPRGAGYLFDAGDIHQASDAGGARSTSVHLLVRGDPGAHQWCPE